MRYYTDIVPQNPQHYEMQNPQHYGMQNPQHYEMQQQPYLGQNNNNGPYKTWGFPGGMLMLLALLWFSRNGWK